MSKRKDIMLCYPFDEKRFIKWGGKALIQPKLDGERCRCIIDKEGESTLISSQGNIIMSVPHINKALEEIGLKNIELDGELYVHGMPFEEIRSIASRTVNFHPRYEDMEYHVFDIIDPSTQDLRLASLINVIIPYGPIRVVPYAPVVSLEEVEVVYSKIMEKGYEGFILRNPKAVYKRARSTDIMKCKPRKSDTYLITGWEEEKDIYGKLKGRLGSLWLTDGNESFSVGSGFTAHQREKFWNYKETLVGQWCEIKFQGLTYDRQVPRFPVFISISKEGGPDA